MGPARPIAGVGRLLVVIPNWVGDVVLATPALAALRAGHPDARITFLMRRYVGDVLDGCGWHDDALYWPASRGLRRETAGIALALELREHRFDAAVLLTNSFRSAWTVWLARIPRRIGFARDGRSWLLTDRLRPLRQGGLFVPASVLGAYCDLATAAGCPVADRGLRLGITPAQEQAADVLKKHYGIGGETRYAVINPGAAFGAAKCWPAERFSALCNRLSTQLQLLPVIVGAPSEVDLVRAIAGGAEGDVICCDSPGTTLGSLKVMIRDAALLVCNDTGPRHYGNAFRTPTVTIFGPTDQRWTETGYDREVCLQRKVPCGPCQLRVCPLDHRCMIEMTVDMVIDAVGRLIGGGRSSAVSPVGGLAREGA